MKSKNKIASAIAGVVVLGLALSGCVSDPDATAAYDARQEQQKSTTLKDSIALDNLKEKRDRENDPNKVRYIYMMSFGQIIGYYVAKGNITSNASQMAPEQEIVRRYDNSDALVVDGASDDGTFGAGDPGIFFFTADGTMVVTSLDYIQSDQPLAIDVPRLGGSE
jgi:hypothetical protein